MTTFLNLPRFDSRALCAESPNPDQWFPPSGGEGVLIAAQAKAICRRCPSLGPCRDYALANPDVRGLWGAWSDRDREVMRRQSPAPKRQRTHCSNGHRFTEENTQVQRAGRRCRTCHNRRKQAAS